MSGSDFQSHEFAFKSTMDIIFVSLKIDRSNIRKVLHLGVMEAVTGIYNTNISKLIRYISTVVLSLFFHSKL